MRTFVSTSFKIFLLLFLCIFPFLLFGQNNGQDQKKIDAVIAKVYTFEVNYKPTDLRHIAIKMIDDSKKIDYDKGLAYGNYFLGRVFISLLDNKKSIYYANLSLEYLKSSNDKVLKSSNYALIGACYQQLQFYGLAVQNYKRSLNAVKNARIDAVAKQQMESNNYFNISDTYSSQDNFDSAYVYLNKNKSLYTILKSPHNFAEESSVYMKIGEYFTQKNNLDSAAFYINKSLTLLQGKNHIYESQALKYKADLYNKERNFSEAIKYGLLAMKVAEKFKDTSSEIEAVQALQTYYNNTQDYKNLAIYSNRNQQMNAELKKQSDAERNEVFEEILEEKKIESDRFKNMLAVLFFVVLITVLLVLHYLKRSKLLAFQKNTIEVKNVALENLTRDLSLSNKTIQNTFSIIAHDLRNPFNALLGYTTLLINNFDHFNDEEKLADLKKINYAAETNYNLTQNLLSWSLKQQGGYVISKTENNLPALVNQCVESLDAFIKFKNIKVWNNTHNISVFVDRDIILTILNNLLSNAIKYGTENTDIEILSTHQNDITVLEIWNYYEILDEEMLEHIQKYFASEPEENAEYEMGFGLKIVKEMADLHHAKIECEKKGSKLVVMIILHKG